MALNKQLFKAYAPEFSDVDSTRLGLIADSCELQLNPTLWGDKYDTAVALLVAHTLKMAERAGTPGAVASEKVGDLARSYFGPANADNALEMTSYGQEFLRIRRTLQVSPFLSVC